MILGATTDSSRYAYLASTRLAAAGHPIINAGNKTGIVAGVPIEPPLTIHGNVHTITLYINPLRQVPLYEFILATKPIRILFNPGTENEELSQLALSQGIVIENACTLVLLAINQY